MPLMTLMRLTIAGPMSAGRVSTSWSAPSMRIRTRILSPCGSMWTSDARSRSACVTSRFTTGDHRCVLVDDLLQLRRLGGDAGGRRRRGRELELADVLADVGQRAVRLVDGAANLGRRREQQLDVVPGRALQLADDVGAAGVRDDDLEPSVLGDAHRNGEQATGDGLGQARQRGLVGLLAPEVDQRQAGLVGERLRQPAFVERAELHQEAPETLAGTFLLEQRALQLVGRDELVRQQQLTEPLRSVGPGAVGGRRVGSGRGRPWARRRP